MWDSNPRTNHSVDGFRNRSIRPLWQSSVLCVCCLIIGRVCSAKHSKQISPPRRSNICSGRFQQPLSFFVGTPQLQHQQGATLRLVPVTGLEPVRAIHRTLIPARLPIPPHRRVYVKCGAGRVQCYQLECRFLLNRTELPTLQAFAHSYPRHPATL